VKNKKKIMRRFIAIFDERNSQNKVNSPKEIAKGVCQGLNPHTFYSNKNLLSNLEINIF